MTTIKIRGVMKAGACDARARLATGFSPALVQLFDTSAYAIQRPAG